MNQRNEILYSVSLRDIIDTCVMEPVNLPMQERMDFLRRVDEDMERYDFKTARSTLLTAEDFKVYINY